MEIIDVHSNCPNCGAPVELDTEAQAFVCKYCSSIIAVVSRSSTSTETSQPSSPILRKVEPELKYQANHQVSALNAQGGHLWITKDEVVFKPHSLNFGPMGKRYIRIQDVVGYKKEALTHMSIFTKNGYEMDIVVWKKDEIINEIEKRRINFFQSQGLSVPPLQYGSGFSGSSNISDGAVSAEQMSSNSGCLGIIATFIITTSIVLYSLFA
ncbi:hypothetical protein [Bacteroides caecimuris]|uniref:hypothetical protein n=1 Tax=Bacteroides caecimuris TaxID=1796613 RepID=UPI00263A5291|nr:hypothetical protein [Bacteroides caecimuris]